MAPWLKSSNNDELPTPNSARPEVTDWTGSISAPPLQQFDFQPSTAEVALIDRRLEACKLELVEPLQLHTHFAQTGPLVGRGRIGDGPPRQCADPNHQDNDGKDTAQERHRARAEVEISV